MVERRPLFDFACQAILLAGCAVVILPFAVVAIAASLDLQAVNAVPLPLLPGGHFLENLADAWQRTDLGRKILNSLLFASAVAAGKVVLSAMAAFTIVYFRFPGRTALFWLIFTTLMLPLEVRIVPTYAIAVNALAPFQAIIDAIGLNRLCQALFGLRISLGWNLLDSYAGLVLPLVATATGTFLYRQFFLTLPEELAEAARLDGAGPLRFFFQILLPLSRANMVALFTIMFVWAWNQYLWPMLVTTDAAHGTAVTELKALIPDDFGLPAWNLAMAGTLIVMLPPLLVVVFLQRWFVRGLIAVEK